MEKLKKIKTFFKKYKKELANNFAETQSSVNCKPIKDFFFFKYDEKIFHCIDIPKKLERDSAIIFNKKFEVDLNDFELKKIKPLGFYRPVIKNKKSYDSYSLTK